MKRYCSDVFDNLSSDASKAFSGYTVRQPLDELSRRRIYESVMADIERQSYRAAPRAGLKLSKVSVVAAACVVAATVGAVGVGASRMYKGLADYRTSYTEVQKAAVEKATFAINKQMSGSGVTITATEAMCDGNKFFVLLRTEIDPSQIKVSDDATFGSAMELHMTGDPTDTQGYSAVYHEVLEREGNVCTQLAVFDMGDVTDGQQLGLSARGLYVTSADGKDSAAVISDEAGILGGIQFAVTKNSFAKAFSAENGVKHLGQNAQVSEGYIAPWFAQFTVGVESDDISLLKAGFAKDKAPSFKVVMKDGTTHEGIGVDNGASAGGAKSEGYHGYYDFRCAFKEYVEVSEIDHVEVNGTSLSLQDVTLTQALVLTKPPVA